MRTPAAVLALVVGLSTLALSCATDRGAGARDGSCPHCASPGAGPGGPMHPGMGGPGQGGPGGMRGGMMLGAASPTAVPPGVTPVQNEMRLLSHAFHRSMTAAALGDVSVIPAYFHPVHQARALTDRALESGSWKPAVGELASFKAMDAAFHAELEKLVAAAQTKDAAAVVEQLDHLLPSCVACHSVHRAPGLPVALQPTEPAPSDHSAH